MADFFTVDRRGSLTSGQVIDLDLNLTGRPFNIMHGHYTESDLERLTHDLFSEGLSEWGKSNLFNQYLGGSDIGAIRSSMIEITVELVRRTEFSEHPSRFSCAFGWGSLTEAETFRTSYGPTAPIFRVSCERSVRRDFNLLTTGLSTLGAWLYATKYWRGDASPNPQWEHLLVPPVTIMDRVG